MPPKDKDLRRFINTTAELLQIDNEPDRVLPELLAFIENEQDFYDSRQSTKKLDC